MADTATNRDPHFLINFIAPDTLSHGDTTTVAGKSVHGEKELAIEYDSSNDDYPDNLKIFQWRNGAWRLLLDMAHLATHEVSPSDPDSPHIGVIDMRADVVNHDMSLKAHRQAAMLGAALPRQHRRRS